MANSRTIARIEARIRERAAIILQTEISDPRASFVTVTRVEVNSDLQSGKIFYSVYGTPGDRSKASHMLKNAAGYIQRLIAPALSLRRMPRLEWHYDETVEKAAELDQLIQEARQRDEQLKQQSGGSEESAPSDAEPNRSEE